MTKKLSAVGWWIPVVVIAILWLSLALGESATHAASGDASMAAQPLSAPESPVSKPSARYRTHEAAELPASEEAAAGAGAWLDKILDGLAAQAGASASEAARLDPVVAEGMAEELRKSIEEETRAGSILIESADR